MSIEQRLRQLEDVQAITELTYRYARAVNTGPRGKAVDGAAIPRLFTAGARWSGDGLGTAVGSAAIAAELLTATAMVEFSAHAFLNPLIVIEGDAATGSWLLWIASVHAREPATVYLGAELSYLRTTEGWRIDSVQIDDGMRIAGV